MTYRYANPLAVVYVCEACGSRIEEPDRDLHVSFHAALLAVEDKVRPFPGSHVLWFTPGRGR